MKIARLLLLLSCTFLLQGSGDLTVTFLKDAKQISNRFRTFVGKKFPDTKRTNDFVGSVLRKFSKQFAKKVKDLTEEHDQERKVSSDKVQSLVQLYSKGWVRPCLAGLIGDGDRDHIDDFKALEKKSEQLIASL